MDVEQGAWAPLFMVSDVDGDGNADMVGWGGTTVYVIPLEDTN